jgi:hypothetical protein
MSDNKAPTDLAYASTREIMDELGNRFDTLLICGHRDLRKDIDDALMMSTGSDIVLLGLIEYMKQNLLVQSISNQFEDSDGDE